jgi:hypothetical protein
MKNSKTKKKSIIDIYPTIYNVDIVVANKYTTIAQINKHYETVDHNDFLDDKALAFVQPGYNKKTNRAIILVKHCNDYDVLGIDKKADLINTCAHEALHVCMRIYSKIGEEVFKDDSNELFAYLLGWVTECIYRTWTKV